MRCQANWNRFMQSSSSNRKLKVAINVVQLGDKAWLDNFLDVKVDTESIVEEFKLLNENYPLFIVIASNANSWLDLNQSNDRHITNKIILDYISLCDNRGEGES